MALANVQTEGSWIRVYDEKSKRISEMSSSNVSFNAIKLDQTGNNIFNQIVNKSVEIGTFDSLKNGKALEQYIDKLNKFSSDFDSLNSAEKLMALQSLVTGLIVSEKIKL